MNEFTWKIWDPRKREDYLIRNVKTGESFSSLAACFFAIEIAGNFPWQDKTVSIRKLFCSLSATVYFVHQPWQRKSLELLQTSQHIGNLLHLSRWLIYGRINPSKISAIFEIWFESGAWLSGEWLLLGFSAEINFDASAAEQGLLTMLREQKCLNVAIELQEMQQSLIMAKNVDGVADLLVNLLEV